MMKKDAEPVQINGVLGAPAAIPRAEPGGCRPRGLSSSYAKSTTSSVLDILNMTQIAYTYQLYL